MKRNNFLGENSMNINLEKIKENFPEISLIKNNELREKVAIVWAVALEESNFKDLNDVGEKIAPKFSIIKHIRSVANMSIAIFESLEKVFPDFIEEVDRDILISGALCHDVGILFEKDPIINERWRKKMSITGYPALRHPVYGVYLALKVGLPLRVVHIIGAHSPEGEFIKRSLECSIVHHADYLYWEIYARKEWGKPAHHENKSLRDIAKYYMEK